MKGTMPCNFPGMQTIVLACSAQVNDKVTLHHVCIGRKLRELLHEILPLLFFPTKLLVCTSK